MQNIIDVIKKIDLTENDIDLYGKYKAKINLDYEKINNKEGNLILVTSTSPTPYGEGKTTLTIGLNDSLNKLGMKSVGILREPSLGPVFGSKGGATGGGKAIVEPAMDINLHFNGDFHAIESANNLLCAIIDNHIYQGNDLEIDEVVFNRCIDINDRELRNIKLNNRTESFNITPASEIMAILCLSKNIEYLKLRLDKIIVGYTKEKKEIYAKDLKCTNALVELLKEAMQPNIVQSIYGNPVIIHGGPFANIAHGCNSIIATKLGLKLANYVITEAGFGSDMGAIKFFDIKCRDNNIYPKVVVINTTIQSLKYNGDNLETGIDNLKYHILNMKKFCSNIIVSLNKFESDSEDEIEYVKNYSNNLNVEFVVSEMYSKGDIGCIDLANKIISMNDNTITNRIYDVEEHLLDKINKLTKYFNCNELIYNDEIKEKINYYDKYKLPICIAKTQYSITDNPKLLGNPINNKMTITDIKVSNGAGFIVIYLGNILTLPGLGKKSNYLKF